MRGRGLFVTFEGPEGAGKTTQARLLEQFGNTGDVEGYLREKWKPTQAQLLEARLRETGLEVVRTEEPGGTELGRRLRELLTGLGGAPIHPLAELFLFLASRAQLVEEVIRPALSRGCIVVCDRYADSTIAYQGYGRGLDLALVRQAVEAATGGLWPDLTVLLDLPAEEGLARKKEGRNRFEVEDLAFHRRVRAGYLEMAASQPGRWLVIEARLPAQEIAAQVWRRVSELMGEGKGGGA